MSISIAEGKASEKDIYNHLFKCKYNFIPPLDEYVNIDIYSQKIHQNAITFEAWSTDTLVGLVAAYFNDQKGHIGFITNVSVVNDFMGMGIASILLNKCINYAKNNNYKNVVLEVSEKNKKAIHLYKKLGFKEFENKNEKVLMIVNI